MEAIKPQKVPKRWQVLDVDGGYCHDPFSSGAHWLAIYHHAIMAYLDPDYMPYMDWARARKTWATHANWHSEDAWETGTWEAENGFWEL